MKKEDFKFSKDGFIPFYRGYLGPNKDLPEDLLDSNGLLISDEKDSKFIAAINRALEISIDVTNYNSIDGKELCKYPFFSTVQK